MNNMRLNNKSFWLFIVGDNIFNSNFYYYFLGDLDEKRIKLKFNGGFEDSENLIVRFKEGQEKKP